MKVKVKYLHMLLDAVCEKSGKSKTHFGLKEAALLIGLGESYLYKNIFDKIKNLGDDETIGIGPYQLSLILKFIEYLNLQSFIEYCERPIEPILVQAVGSYYSYVRENSDQGNILRSPVRIYIEDRSVHFELRGPMLTYNGKVTYVNGCLFITMASFSGKSFHHVYKIGLRERPEVLCGAFTGVSTAFDPIGGRVVLERCERGYEHLTPQRLKIRQIKKRTRKTLKFLGVYFNDRVKNNLIIPKPVTFTHEDLAGG